MSRRAFVIGHPVAHSRSPLIHGYWLDQYGIAGDYVKIDVAPEALPGFVTELRAGSFVGGNVTVPLKQDMMALCDETDALTRAIGAVNTVYLDGDRLIGTNTDWFGFLANLDAITPGWDKCPGPAVVLGAGGAARGIVAGLAKRGFAPIRILNRTASRAEALARDLDTALGVRIEGAGLARFAEIAGESTLVVNTSTIGMNGTRFEHLPLDLLPETALVSDIVYTPLVTPLLAEATARGLRTADGLGMLLHQATPGFEAWFGTRPEVTGELRALVERDMGLA